MSNPSYCLRNDEHYNVDDISNTKVEYVIFSEYVKDSFKSIQGDLKCVVRSQPSGIQHRYLIGIADASMEPKSEIAEYITASSVK